MIATGQQGNRREVIGLDEGKGNVSWRFAERAGYPSLVATNDGGVAVSSASGTVTQVIGDRDGRIRWSQPARPPTPLAGGTLIQVTPGPTPFGNDLLENVQGRWGGGASSERPLDPAGSSFYEADGALLHAQIGPQGGTFARLDPTTGHVLWRISTQVYTVTAAGDELVDLETSGFQQGTEMLVARDPSTGAVRWQAPLSGPTIGSAVGGDVFRVKLFALTGPAGATLVDVNSTDVTGLDPATGKTRWNVALPSQTTIDGMAAAGDGIVIQISDLAYAIEGH